MARPHSHAFFATPLGECAIAWNDVGVTHAWLPAGSPEALRRSVARRSPAAAEAAPTTAIAALIEAIGRLLAGERVDLGAARLDLDEVDEFDRRVYAVTRRIGAGEVLSYGQVAARVGDGATAREVGQALGRNPVPIIVPCHRVIATGGGLGGFSAPGGSATKGRLLAIEEARPSGPPGLFDTPGPPGPA